MTKAGMTAVVCDDEPAKRSAVSELLIRAGCALVVQTPSLEQMQQFVANTSPAIVVLDLALTGMSGLDVVRELHRTSPSSAVVVLTPFTSLREAALAAGAQALISVHDLRDLEGLVASLSVPRPRLESIHLDAPATPAQQAGT